MDSQIWYTCEDNHIIEKVLGLVLIKDFSKVANELSDIEYKLLAEIQHGLPRTATPYADVAKNIGTDVEEVLSILKNWKADGRVRRVGAIVNHFKVGLEGGSMVVWAAPADKVIEIGEMFSSFPEVSHAYERPSGENWPFNLYTMVHGSDAESVTATVEKMSQASGVKEYHQLETERELKKVPPTYIIE